MAALNDSAQSGGKQAQRADMIEAIKQAGSESMLATLTLKDLDNPPKETVAPANPAVRTYTCITQVPDSGSFAKILVGDGNKVPRWNRGSTINFATSSEGFPSKGDAVYAAKKLIEAAEEWNSHKVGVTFKWVEKLEDAAFVLRYGGASGTVLAMAFFPNSNALSTLFVYEYGFDKGDHPEGYTNYGIMKNVFLHELGHVLGLRHEFAMDPDPDWFEGGAFLWGTKNDKSVMSYNFPPVIQKSDVADTRSFYQFPLIVNFNPDN